MPNNTARHTRLFISRQELSGGTAQRPIVQQAPSANERLMLNRNLKASSYANESSRTLKTILLPIDEQPKNHSLINREGRYRDLDNGKLTLLDLGGEVTLIRKKGLPEYYAARQLHKDKANGILSQLAKIRHENILAAIETFTEGKNIYMVVDKILLSLIQIVRSPPTPNAREIGTIMGQILDGLVYLQTKELAHGSLSCINVLINEQGTVKLVTSEPFVNLSPETVSEDMAGIAEISMMLMQKYKLNNGKVGVEKIEAWQNSDIIDFLSCATSSIAAVELRRSPFIHRLWNPESGWPKEELYDLVQTALLTVPRNFRGLSSDQLVRGVAVAARRYRHCRVETRHR